MNTHTLNASFNVGRLNETPETNNPTLTLGQAANVRTPTGKVRRGRGAPQRQDESAAQYEARITAFNAERALKARQARAENAAKFTSKAFQSIVFHAGMDKASDLIGSGIGADPNALKDAVTLAVAASKRYTRKQPKDGEIIHPDHTEQSSITRSGLELIEQLCGENVEARGAVGRVHIPDFTSERVRENARLYAEMFNGGHISKSNPLNRITENRYAQRVAAMDTSGVKPACTTTEQRSGRVPMRATGLVISDAWNTWLFAGIKPHYPDASIVYRGGAVHRPCIAYPLSPDADVIGTGHRTVEHATPVSLTVEQARKLQATIAPSLTIQNGKPVKPHEPRTTPDHAYPTLSDHPVVLHTSDGAPYCSYPRLGVYGSPVTSAHGALRTRSANPHYHAQATRRGIPQYAVPVSQFVPWDASGPIKPPVNR